MKLAKLSRFTPAALRALAPTLGDEAAEIAADVESGRNELWQVNGGKAYLVTCVAGGDLVICCVAGEGLAEIATHFLKFARAQGLRRVRWFTRRPGLARLLRPVVRPTLAGYVFHVDLGAH